MPCSAESPGQSSHRQISASSPMSGLQTHFSGVDQVLGLVGSAGDLKAAGKPSVQLKACFIG